MVTSAPTSFYSRWQPLLDEDRHTALVFGFFRHAPTRVALDPWLSHVLERPAAAEPLTLGSFWPMLPSVVDGSSSTEPELVFTANDAAGPLTVVVEVKPGYSMHTLEQLSREVIDVATTHRPVRLALVMVGADLSRPTATANWDTEIANRVRTHGLQVATELRYSSFAQAGHAIKAASQLEPAWATYAADVCAQLTRKGLLGYGGAPMLDDLDQLNPRNAIEAYNRITKAARQFYLQLHAQPDFIATGLTPDVGSGGYVNARMQRDGRTDVITQPEETFETTTFLSIYTHPTLPNNDRVFIAFDLLPQGPDIELIAGRWHNLPTNEALRRIRTAITHTTETHDAPDLPFTTTDGATHWRYDRRPWRPGQALEDITWTTHRATAALTPST